MPRVDNQRWARSRGRRLRLLLGGTLLLSVGGLAISARGIPTEGPGTEIGSSPIPPPVVATREAAPTPTPQAEQTPQPTPTPPPTPTPQPESPHAHLAGSLAERIDPLVADIPAEVGIVVALPDGTRLYEHQPDRLFEAASLYKLGIMVELYRQREAGWLSFDETITLLPAYFEEGADVYDAIGTAVPIDDLLWAMIAVSSNVAAHALLDRVGNEAVNATMADLGLVHTEIRWRPGYVSPPKPEPESTPEPTPAPESQRDTPSPPGVSSTEPDNMPTAEPIPPDDQSDEPAEDGSRGSVDPLDATSNLASARPRAGRTPSTPRLAALAPGPIPAPPQLADADSAYNVTTPADMARLFHLLLDGAVVSPEASQEMLDLLAQQTITDRLPVLLPPGTRVAHKTGNLPGIVHDAGVIYAPAGPVIVAVLSEDAKDEWAVMELAREVAAIAYESRS